VVDGFPSFLFFLVFLDADVLNFFGSDPVDVESMDHLNDVDPVSVSVGNSSNDFIIIHTEWLIFEFSDGTDDFFTNWDDVEEEIFPVFELVPASILVGEAMVDHIITDLLDLTGFSVLEAHVKPSSTVGLPVGIGDAPEVIMHLSVDLVDWLPGIFHPVTEAVIRYWVVVLVDIFVSGNDARFMSFFHQDSEEFTIRISFWLSWAGFKDGFTVVFLVHEVNNSSFDVVVVFMVVMFG